MKIPTMDELYNSKTGATSFEFGNREIFVNFNRFLKPFIRVNIYPDKTKTFPFTRFGYESAIKYFKEDNA